MKNVELKYPVVLRTQQKQTVTSVMKCEWKGEDPKVRKLDRKLNYLLCVYKIPEFRNIHKKYFQPLGHAK